MASFGTVRLARFDTLLLARYCTLVSAHSGKLDGEFVSSAAPAPGRPPGCTPASAPSGTSVLALTSRPVSEPAGTALLAHSGTTAWERWNTPPWALALAHLGNFPSAPTNTAPSAPSCKPPSAGWNRIDGEHFDILASRPGKTNVWIDLVITFLSPGLGSCCTAAWPPACK